MTITAAIASFGDDSWRKLAISRAVPSADAQSCLAEVIHAHDPNGTIASVRNEVAAAVTGEWVLFLDADDELDANFSSAMTAAIKEHTAGLSREEQRLLLFTPRVEYVMGARRRQRKQPRFWPERDIRGSNWLVIGTLIHRDLFAQIGGFRVYGWSEDWDLWARAFIAGARVVKVPDAIYVAHVSPRSRNRSAPRSERLYWHQRIGADNWPNIYDQPSEIEDDTCRLATNQIRLLEPL